MHACMQQKSNREQQRATEGSKEQQRAAEGSREQQRAAESSKEQIDALERVLQTGMPPRVQLDNTFAHPEYDFPSREEAYQGLINIVKSHKDHRIFLFSYSLGKEEVFLNLANDFKCKIVVDEARMRKIQLMDLKPELFTTDPT